MDFEEYVVDLNASCVCGCMNGNRFHKIYRFPNRYGASVASNPKIKGFSEIGYRILPIVFLTETEYEKVKLPFFDKEILECDVWDEVQDALQRISGL